MDASHYAMTKCNTDGAAHGSPGIAACGEDFRDSNAMFKGCFTYNIGITYALHAELIVVMYDIEIA